MTELRVIRVDAVQPQRWRNGGGWTRELLALPDAENWRIRVSVADIESDGPFSSFPGVQRLFVVLEGAGVELTIDGKQFAVRPGSAPVKFAGEAQTSCRLLDGPTRDLNFMVRETAGTLDEVVPGKAWHPPAQSCGLFTLTPGHCRADDMHKNVDAFSLLWFERSPVALTFDSAGFWLAE
jgi:environmental stress-induced protein Ves